LWACLGLAVLLHGLLLLPLQPAGSALSEHGNSARQSRPVLQTRAVRTARLDLMPSTVQTLVRFDIGPATEPLLEAVPELQPTGVNSAPAAASLLWAGPLRINSPDMAIPGERLRLRVWLELDQQGGIQALQASEPAAELEPFLEAIATGITRAGLTAQNAEGQAARAWLCLNLQFQERAPVEIELSPQAPSQRGRCLAGLGALDSAR
jgi:hypothetical protein